MNPDSWKDFINGLFVREDGTRKRANITLAITSEDGGRLEIPNLNVAHTDTLQDIFRSIKDSNTESVGNDQPISKEAPKKKVMNVEHIQYRNAKRQTNKYIVRRMEDDSFVVQLETGELIEDGSATHKGVVKKYKKQFKP